jgi:hypothetical protein
VRLPLAFVFSCSFAGVLFVVVCLALERTPSEDDRHEIEDNAQTIRPTRSPGLNTIPLAQPPSSEIQPIVEDYSDMASEEDEELLQAKVANFKVRFLRMRCHPFSFSILYLWRTKY